MRWLLLVLAVLKSSPSTAQIQTAWIDDTAKVILNVFEGDTTYRVKWKLRSGEWKIYYDVNYSHIATWIKFRSEFSFQDSCWSRSGKLVSYWIDKDDLAYACYESKSWFPNGQLHFENYCDGDTALHHEYYYNGQLKHESKSHKDSVSRWMFDHYATYYYENGQAKCDPQNNIGPWWVGNCYYQSGRIKANIDWEPGKISVHHYEWFENGNYRIKGQYEVPANYRIFDPRNVRVGTWSYYSESGKLIKQEYYEEGKLVRTLEY